MNQPIKREPPPFMYAVEAVLGLQLKGKPVTEETVRAWLDVALGGNADRIAPVMFHARRIINGPAPEGQDARAHAGCGCAAG